jgi:hypothetical protein
LPIGHQGWGYISSFDEWVMVLLFDRSDPEIILLPNGDEVPDREKHLFQRPKLMLTFVWNPHGVQVVDGIPRGKMFRAAS